MSILVLDPVSAQLYRWNTETETYTQERSYSQKAAVDISNELKDLDKLTILDKSGWTFKSPEAKKYRYRRISKHLIQPSACRYPSFITFRELSSAFASVTSIRLYVDISRYIRQNLEKDSISGSISLSGNINQSFRFSKMDKIIECKVSLVSTVKETIQYMCEKIYNSFGFVITPLNSNNHLTFKVRGKKEYFVGNYPMLVYRSIRNSLRGMQFLAVNLTEVPNDLDMPLTIYINDSEPLRNLYNFYMYYVPDSTSESPTLKKFEKTNSLKSFFFNDQEEIKIFTGQADWPFRVQLCGMENLYNLFAEAYRGSATDNGTETPRYLVKPKATEKNRESEININKRLNSSYSGRAESVPLLNFWKRKNEEQKGADRQSTKSNFKTLSDSYCPAKTLMDEFKLPFAPYYLRFDVKILYGESVLKNCFVKSNFFPFEYSGRLMEWICFPIKVSEIPKEARIGVNVLAVSKIGESCVIGCCTKPIFDDERRMLTGVLSLNLWPFYKIEESLSCMQEFWGTCTDYETSSYSKLYLKFDSYIFQDISWSSKDYSHIKKMYNSLTDIPKQAGYSIKTRKIIENARMVSGIIGEDPEEDEEMNYILKRPKIDELAALEKILLKDPLEELTDEEKKLLFITRDHYKSIPMALLLFLKAIDWTKPLQVAEAYKYLQIWVPMQPEDSISLLLADYPDETIRAYAVQKIEEFSDEDIHLYMLQLVQAITFENSHINSLSELLLIRALQNPHQIGHYLFWSIRSQLHVKSKVERLGLLLEQFVMLSGSFREDLIKQINFVNFYIEQSSALSEKDSYMDREKQLKFLIETNIDKAVNLCTLPVDSSIEVSGPDYDQCKVMDSKKMPLWLTLKNSEDGGELFPIIFKTGDDLRQDILSLQLIRVMDMIWLENGLDLRMKPYQVIATGDQSGIIEAVVKAETTAKIHREYGGTLGALKNNTFRDYLLEHNPSEELIDKALDNFIRSSAGYCVATYILGIGDRHNGNIMITRTGHLFHIDFGHFLGNFKTALGIQRERSKFVLTEEMVFAMGGKESEGFKRFKEYCCKAYNFVRNHGKRFINLFLFMVTAGMPELQKKKEIEYLREMLSLKLTEMEANSRFLEEIETSLNNTFRRFDNLMHNFKH